MSKFIPVSQPVLSGNEKKYILDCVDSGWISSAGEYIRKFEALNASYFTTKHGVAVSNGTTALQIALTVLGVDESAEVLVPGFTFAATVNAVLHAGAIPVLGDVELSSWTLDVDSCQELVTNRTKVIMPVHIMGQPCDMQRVMSFAEKYNLAVIEDCAEAHGAEFAGQKVGSFGDVGCFSFYGNKIVTCGEGGTCVTNNAKLADKIRVLRDHGMHKQKRYWHDEVGHNYRMTNMQAAIGCAQMETIEQALNDRERIARTYESQLQDHPAIQLQQDIAKRKRVCWIFSCLIDIEQVGLTIPTIQKKLMKHNIDSRPFFFPIHHMPPYQQLRRHELPNTETISTRGISLPTFVGLSDEQIDYICTNLIRILDGS